MQLAIVLLSWKDTAEAEGIAEGIRGWQQLRPLLILVENESPQGDQRIIDANGTIRLYSQQNRGYGGGNNLGIREAINQQAQYILLLNPDTQVTEKTVSKLLEVLAASNTRFAVGPKLLEGQPGAYKVYAGGQDIGQHFQTRIPYQPAYHTSDLLTVDYTIGALLLLSAKHLQEVGLFDEQYFFNGEVGDLCKRARQLGYTSHTLLTVNAIHKAHPNPLRSTLYAYYSHRSRFQYTKKHQLGLRQLSYWVQYFLRTSWYLWKQGNHAAARAMRLAIWHGLIGKYGNQHTYFIK